jgi:hypothetical protein
VRLHAVVGSVILLVGTTGAPAGAAFCVKPNGKVVAHANGCKRKETPLVLSLPPGAPGATGPAGTSQPKFRAVDATGQRLPGSLNYTGELVLRVGDVVFALDIGSAGFTPGTLLFPTDACTETPLVYASSGLYAKARVQRTTAWYAAGEPTMRHIESTLTPTSLSDCMGIGKTYDAVTGLCCADAAFDTLAAEAATFDVGAFVPPFHAELEE